MIKTAKLTRYSNDRFVNFFQSVVDMFDANDPNLGTYLTDLKITTDELKAAYEYERKNEMTDSVETLDNRRDKDLRGIKLILRGFTLHYESNTVDAAKRLLQSMNDIDKNMHRLPYIEETNAVRQLTTLWNENTQYVADLTTLNLSTWNSHLQTTNESFQSTYLGRVSNEAAKDIVPVTRLRNSALEPYNTFVQFLMAYATIDAATYSPIVNNLNELIEQYNK